MGEDENKKIAELYFGTDRALQGLEKIDAKLKSVSTNSENYTQKIKQNFDKTFDFSQNIDFNKFNKQLANVTQLSEKQAQKMVANIMQEELKTVASRTRNNEKRILEEQKTNLALLKSEQITADKKSLIAANLDAFKEKQAIKEEARNNRMVKSSKTMYDKIGDYAKTYLIYQGFNELKQSAKELVDEMVNVEYQMVQIDRVLNDSSLNINDYRDKLIQLAYDYGNSFDNVADITLRLAQAGFDAQESLALTEKTLLALNTAELNATQATSDMVAIMSQWNLMTGTATEVSEEYGKIIDYINITADRFPTTSEDLLNALKKTSSAFNIAGASIEETIAMITAAEVASQRGGKAIGTAMNNIITQLKDEKRLNIMESLGIDLYANEAKTEFNSIIDIITQLSEKMQELQASGKENTTEMQELLSVFTIFRRNIGSGLLSGVAGEDSIYNQVLTELTDAVGYSMEENEKHMKTAKAAMEQFNATLLELKTTVWDGGVEDVFRGLLVFGNDAVNSINNIIDSLGVLPTSIGAVVLAYSALNKQWKASVEFDPSKGGFLKGFSTTATGKIIDNIKNAELEVKKFQNTIKSANASNLEISDSFKRFVNSVQPAQVNTKNYISYLVKMKAATIAAHAATIALNAALSLGLSAGISLIISGIDKIIHYKENDIKKTKEEIDAINENISSYEQEKEKIDELIKSYDALSKIESTSRTTEQQIELEKSQNEITQILKQQGKYVDELNGKYEEQAEILKDISKEQLGSMISQYEVLLDKYTELNKVLSGEDLEEGFLGFTGVFKTAKLVSQKNKAGIEQSLEDIFDLETVDEQISALTEWQKQLRIARSEGKDVGEIYSWVNETLGQLKENNQKVTDTQMILNELYQQENDILSDNNATEARAEYTYDYVKAVSDEISSLEKLQEKYEYLSTAVTEYNKNGQITVETFKNIAENNLWQYLEVVNGKLKINNVELNASDNQAKENAKADLQAEAAAQILSIVQSDLNTKLSETKNSGSDATIGIKNAGDAALEAAKKAVVGATSFDMFNKAMEGEGISYSGISANAKKEINNVLSQLNAATKVIDGIALTAAKSSAGSSKSATETFKEQSEERVRIFKEEIDELESLEKSWVNKYKKLELFGSSDLKFITNQRISRYKEYLNQIQQLQGISEEDRLELSREYQSKLQEVELEYFDILKDELEDQIDALEKANDEKIKLIEEEADAQIEALKKVESENDRIREKEEYERKRNELIYGNQGIEYWRQRTGREAQQALMEAEQELKELDEDWNEKKEEWTLEDQIEEIEDARDAQIKAIEEAQETQIQAWKEAYQAQVDLYAQTGQIIYDGSVINAGYLYKAYMDNFVTPFNGQLRNVINSINSASAAADGVISKMKSISSGGGNTGSVSQALGPMQGPTQEVRTWTQVTTLKNKGALESSDAVLNNKTSSSTSLLNQLKKKIGKFHGGGQVATAANEALAIVRKNEVVLRPEWAEGMNKLVKEVNKGNVFNNNTATNIKVDGDLIKLEAKVNSKKEADDLAKTIGEVLEKKFNIRK